MSLIPSELKYVDTHEWIKVNEDGTAVIGITDHAQAALGDLVFVDAPKMGAKLEVGDACGVVESVKAASDIYAPLAGEVIEVNAGLADEPELLNSDPYGEGWIWKMRLADPAAAAGLLSADAYSKLLA